MLDEFNPYREWLGLEFPGPRPNHYQLLGLTPGESDAGRVQQAAERATVKVRSHRPGVHATDWARMLDEIQAAKSCLLDPQQRLIYDRELAAANGPQSGMPTNPAPAAGSGLSKLLRSAPPVPADPRYPPGMSPAKAPADYPIAGDAQREAVAPPAVSAPTSRMEVQSASPSRDLLPPGARKDEAAEPARPANPAPPAVNPAPLAPNPAPYVNNPAPAEMLPPTALAYSPAMQPAPAYPQAATGYPPVASAWGQPAAPAGAWGSPAPMTPPAQPWGMPPPSAGPSYPYAPAANPMTPAGAYGSPMPGAMPMAMPISPMNYGPAPVADPMAPAPYGASGYGPPAAYGQPPAYGTPAYGVPQAPAYGPPAPAYGVPSAAPQPYSSYGVADPMQPLGIPASAYAPPGEAIPTAVPTGSAVPTAIPMAVPVGAPIAQAVTAAPAVGFGTPSETSLSKPGDNVTLRAAPSRKSGNSLLLLVVGGGGAVLLIAIVLMVLNNQQKPAAIAQNNNNQSTEIEPAPPVKPNPPQPRSKPLPEGNSGNPSEEMPAKPEKPTPDPEPAKPTPPKPEPAKPEPAKPEPVKPETPDPKPGVKPTKAQVAELSKLLTAARQALRELKFEEVETNLAQAEALPKLPEHDALVVRLTQLSGLTQAYLQAFEAGKKKLAAGQSLVVGASTQTEVAAVSDEKITVKIKGQERTFPWSDVSQGLFLAIADSNFEADNPQKKVQKGAYLIAKADDAKEAEKGKVLWEEAGPLTAALLPVAGDKYELAQLEALVSAEMKPAPGENPSPVKPGTPVMPLLKKVREEIGGHQFSQAEKLLKQAEPLLATDDERGKHGRLLMLLDYTKQFKAAIDRTLARETGGNTFEVGKTVVVFVEIKPTSIVVRAAGTNRTYQRNELPVGMAVALGDKSLAKDTPETKIIRAAYVVACSNKPEELDKAKTWWEEASRSGKDTKNLIPLITDDYGKN